MENINIIKTLKKFCIDNNFVKIQEYDVVTIKYVKEINKYFRVYIVIDLLNDNKLLTIQCENILENNKISKRAVFSLGNLRFLINENMQMFFYDYIENIIFSNVEEITRCILFNHNNKKRII